MAKIGSKLSKSRAYKLPSNSPEGGTTLSVHPEGRFALAFFGGMLKGTYEILGNTVFFTTEAYPEIALYGRNLASLKDSSQVNFRAERGVYVKLDPDKKDMKPVFNADANCFAFPYVYATDKPLKKIQVAVKEIGNANSYTLFSFDVPSGYNDVMLVKLKDHFLDSHTLNMEIRDGQLYYNGNEVPLEKKPLSDEDKGYLENFLNMDLFPDTLIPTDELFPKENRPKHHNPDEPYHAISPSIATGQKAVIASAPFFIAKCK